MESLLELLVLTLPAVGGPPLIVAVASYVAPRISASLRGVPLLGSIAVRAAVASAHRRGWEGVELLLELAALGVSTPLEAARAALLAEGCPESERVYMLLSDMGLHEEVVRAHYRGCPVPEGLLVKARSYFIAAGLPNWEARASRALGLRSFYEEAGKTPVYVYCRDGRVWLRVSGETLELGPARGISTVGGPLEALEVFLSEARPPLLAYMGDCPHWRGPSVDVGLLSRIAFPDIPSTVAALAYHLDLDPRDPAGVVEHVARAAASILEAVGVDWGRMPEPVRMASALPPLKPLPPRGPRIVVTDSPRLGVPLLKRAHLEPPELGGEGWEYAARAAARALALRLGDYESAVRLASGELGEALKRVIGDHIKEEPPEPPEGPVQVEASALDHIPIPGAAHAEVTCLRPPSSCSSKLPGEPRRVATLRFYDKPIPRDPAGLASAAMSMAGEARAPLIVAPSRVLASVMAESLGARLLEGHESVEEWLLEGGPAVTWYEEILECPEALAVASEVVTVLPERIVARYSRLEDPRSLVVEALQLAAQLGGSTVSRAARVAAAWGVEWLLPVRPEEGAGASVRLRVEDLVDESRRVFGLLWGPGRALRGYQEAAIRALYHEGLSGGAVLVVYPTGAGKSAIFQVAARVLSDAGVGSGAVVVSPLRALIHDQVRGARQRGLKALYIDSSVPREERGRILDAFRAGVLDLVYITPERFHDPYFERLVREGDASLIVLDEAHTLSRWGMSFRPSYLYMARVVRESRASGDPIPLAAFTATAPGDVESDILRALGYEPSTAIRVRVDLDDPNPRVDVPPGRAVVLRAPPLRRELRLDVRLAPEDPQDRLRDLADLVSELAAWAPSVSDPWVGVVFTGYVRSKSRRWANVDDVANALKDRLGADMVTVYHGQLPTRSRRRIEEEVIAASRDGRGPRIVVATKAFGMGVDIPNIRFVVHFTPPDSVEDYYQEVGRAGRDRLEAYAVAYYSPADYRARLALKLKEAPKPSDAVILYNLIASLSVDGEAALPLEAASRVLGDEGRVLRALEMLRRAGLLEYTIKRGAPTLSAELCEARLARGCLAIHSSQRGLAQVEWRICQRDAWFEASLHSNGRRLAGRSSCEGERIPGRQGLYLLAYLNPEMQHKPSPSLPLEPFALLLRSYSLEVSKPEQLMRIMEEALRARLQGGQAAAESKLRRLIADALERPPLKPIEASALKIIGGGRVECGGPLDCAREAASTAARLDAVLGPKGYTLAAPSESLASLLRREAEVLLGRRIVDPVRAYRAVLSAARRGGPPLLANRGVIIVLAREGSRSVEAVERNLEGYPYVWLYLSERPS